MSRARHDDERGARRLPCKPATGPHGNPPICVAPDNQRRRLQCAEATRKRVEPELPQHTSQGAAIRGRRDRRVILVDVCFCHPAGVGIRRAQNAGGDPPAAERGRDRSDIGPACHLQPPRPEDAIPGCIDQYQPSDAIGVCERDLGGDRGAHRVPHEHRAADVQRVEQADDEARIGGVAVSMGRLRRETESPVIECDNAIACGRDDGERVSPGVDRRADSMDEHDRRPASRIDQAQVRVVDVAVLCVERCSGGVDQRCGDWRGTARSAEQRQDDRSA